MYKKQMTFQRIICVVMLIASALVFVYSLGLLTDLYDSLYLTMTDPEDYHNTSVEGAWIYYDMQSFNSNLTIAGIGLIIVSLILFITCTHSRRKYYIGNFVSVGLSTVCNIAVTIWALGNISAYRAQFLSIDFEALKEHADLWKTPYNDSTFWFDAGYLVFGILLLATCLLVVNLILKLTVMKKEASLIGSRKERAHD